MLAKYDFQAFDRTWSICVLTKKAFVNKFGRGIEGLTDANKRSIYLRSDCLNKHVISHELTHVYFFYFGVEAVQLKRYQIEEFACELVALHADSIHRLCNYLYIQLKKQTKIKKRKKRSKDANNNSTVGMEKKRKRYGCCVLK